MSRAVLRTQLSGVARRPARLLLTGLAVLVASFVVFATVLAQQITERTALENLSGTAAQAAFVVGDDSVPATGADLAGIRALPGVAEAVGRFSTTVGFGSPENPFYLQLTADPGAGALALTRTVQGRFPQAANEIAVTPRTADRMGLPVGSTVSVRADPAAAPVELTVTGVVEVEHDNSGQAYALEDAVAALTPAGPSGRIEIRLADGVAAGELRPRIQGVLDINPRPQPSGSATTEPATPQVPGIRAGAEVRAEEAAAALAKVNRIFAVVAMFVAIAVVAAALVAASTFRIVFAQRTRQLALLRAIGAGRGGITGALATEGALTGLVAGTVGVLAGLAFGHGLPPLLAAFGVQASSPGLPLAAALAVIGGTVLITTGAVLAPAYSAARVAPLAALRAAQTAPARRGIGVARLVCGVLLAAGAGGSALLVAGRLPGHDPEDYDPLPMLLGIVGSGALAFFALMLLGPLLVRPLLAVIGWPLRRLGPVGRLAVGGVGGAPRRAAALSTVVALGVTLIAGVLVASASVRTVADREMAVASPADFELTTQDKPIPESVVDQVRGLPEVTHVAAYRRLDDVRVGADHTFDANDLDLRVLPTLDSLDVESGSLAEAGPGRIVLAGYAAEVLGKTTGDQLTLSRDGRTLAVRVAAVLPGPAPLNSALIADPADLDRLGAPAGVSGILADAAQSGEDGRTAGQKALRGVARGAGGLGVTVLADDRERHQTLLDSLVGIALGLVGLTVLIAVVGVGATTALSVVERIRESGLLRAVGLSRAGLRTMLTAESGMYGVLGATLGLLLGVPYAWLAVRALGIDAPPALPVLPLAGVFATLVLLTALAGVMPARRASRVSPVAALGNDD